METHDKPSESNSNGAATVSRRDFLAAVPAATGIALGAAPSVPALAQTTTTPNEAAVPQGAATNPLPTRVNPGRLSVNLLISEKSPPDWQEFR